MQERNLRFKCLANPLAANRFFTTDGRSATCAAGTTSNIQHQTSNAEHRIETPKTFETLSFGVGRWMFSVRCFHLKIDPKDVSTSPLMFERICPA